MPVSDSFIDGLRSRASALSLRAPPMSGLASTPPRIMIDVAGAATRSLSLRPGEQSCADDPDADIVALGMKPAAGFRFAWSEGAVEVGIVALDSGLLADGRPVPAGDMVMLPLPFTLQAGSARIAFEGGKSRAARAPLMSRSVKLAGLVALAAAALAMVLPSRLDPVWQGAGGGAEQVERRWSSISDATANIQRVLARSDLSQRVQVAEHGRGVRLSGEVGGSEVRRWQDAWAAIKTRSDVPVESLVRLDPAESMAGRSIGGVALAPDKYVMARNGQRIRVGETLPDGWTVREINDRRVLLERDGFSESISF